MFDVLDQLFGPLSTHITGILAQPITGTDDQRAHVETKKAYLALLNNIMAAKLQGVFTSERMSELNTVKLASSDVYHLYRKYGRF